MLDLFKAIGLGLVVLLPVMALAKGPDHDDGY